MKTNFTFLLFVLLGLSTQVWAQTPSVLAPVDGATGVAFSSPTLTIESSSTGNSIGDPDFLSVEICDAATFTGFSFFWASSPEVERTDDAPDSYDITGPALSPSTTYYIRAYSAKFDLYSPITSFTTASSPVTGQTRVASISSNATNTGTIPAALTCFPNLRTITYTLNSAIANATQYVIQIDTTSPSFTNVIDSVIFSGTSTTQTVDAGWLMNSRPSGSPTYVRVRGINSTSRGPWSSGSNIRKFGFPLQPCSLIAPTISITRSSFKIWTTRVNRGSRFYFQVDNNSDFSSPNVLTGSFASRNETVTGITGNVFRHNYEVGDNNRAFDYLTQLVNNTTYYVRVRGWNSQQNGYWGDVVTITPSPTITSGFNSPTNLATNVATGATFTFTDNPNFTETSWDFQLSTNAGFTSIISDQAGLTTRSAFVSNLDFNTTYYARVRSNVTAPALQSAWATVQFTTKAAPTLSLTSPTASQVFPNTFVFAYSTWEGSVTEYQWEIEKLTPPTGTQTFTSATFGRNFPTYLARGNSYRIRVRGFAGAQAITGAYSAWVNFSVAPPALPAVQGKQQAFVQSARFGSYEAPVAAAYPNPFTDRIILSLPKDAVQYQVTDISGRLVERNSQAQSVQEIGASWPRGTYLVLVQNAAGAIQRIKVQKQ